MRRLRTGYTDCMRIAFGLVVLVCVSLQAQPPAIRVSASYVKVPVTVFDGSGRIVTGLTRGDFRLYDEGQNRPIENFLLESAPVNVLLLLDASGSLSEELEEIRGAALRFAASFGRDDRFSAISFSDEVQVLQDWTNNRKALRKSLKKLDRGYRTALYDAVAATVSGHFSKVPGRRVIILLTDGLDNESETQYDALIPKLIQTDVTLYIVSRTRLVLPQIRDSVRVDFLNRVMKKLLRDDGDYVDTYFKEKETAMVNLAEATGGRVLFPRYLDELQNSYQEVARELKQQYLLTFLPPAQSEKRFRDIEVVCDQPSLTVHYRRRYSWRSAAEELERPE